MYKPFFATLFAMHLMLGALNVAAQDRDSAFVNTVYTDLITALKEPGKVYRLSLENPGTIGDNIGQLQNLQKLSLHGNDWDHDLKKLPPAIGKLKNLRELYIYNTDLHSLPPEIRGLKKLKILNCPTLTSIPKEISELSALEELSLGKVSMLPATLALLPKLKQLSVSSPSLPVIKSLESLCISADGLLSIHDPAAFVNLKGFGMGEIHDAYDYQVTDDSAMMIINQLVKFPPLRSLNILTMKKLSPQVWNAVCGMNSLEELSVGGYENIIPEEISKLVKLKKIAFNIDSASCVHLSKAPSLEEVELNDLNRYVQYLKNVHKINLQGGFSSFSPENISVLAGLPALEELHVENTYPDSLPVSFKNMAHLKKLILIRTTGLFAEEQFSNTINLLSQLPKLEELTLSSDLLYQLPDEFGKMKSLKQLNVFCYYSDCEEPLKTQLKKLLPQSNIVYR